MGLLVYILNQALWIIV